MSHFVDARTINILKDFGYISYEFMHDPAVLAFGKVAKGLGVFF